MSIFLLTLSAANANCDKLFDRFANDLGFVSWKDSPSYVNKSSEPNKMLYLSSLKLKDKSIIGPKLVMFVEDDHVKFKVLCSRNIKSREEDGDLYYTNSNCTEVREIKYKKGTQEYVLNQETCLEADLPIELSKRCDEIHIPLIKKSEEDSSGSSTGAIKQ